ncbi:MAG TPA: hypothetical protein VM581_02700, partial [Magnetospirillaceae bacterium]|nr:hypothetical protein [Magnetospirillaceae bacterium]
HATDEFVPVGGLSPRDYELVLEAWEGVTPSPEQAYDLAWVELERAMALVRSDINYATEEPYTPKDIAAGFESARQAFRQLSLDPNASRLTLAQARVAESSVKQHHEIVTGKPLIQSCTRYLPYLRTIRTVAGELIDQPDLTADEERFIHGLTVASNLTYHAFTNGWFLPTPPRQSWDITAHSAKRGIHDVQIQLSTGDDPRLLVLEPHEFGDEDDIFVAIRDYLGIEPPDYQPVGRPLSHKSKGELTQNNARANRFRRTEAIADMLISRLNKTIQDQMTLGIILPEDVVKEATKEKPIERDMSDAAVWYLVDFDGQTMDAMFLSNLKELDRLRHFEGILPEERAILSWMQLDYARMLALDAGEDRVLLDEARQQFGVAIELFQSAERQLKRKRRPGEAQDIALAAQVAAVERGLYTSTDRYAVRRIISDYHANAAGLFVKAKDMHGEVDQVTAQRSALSRATLSLLQATADPEIRHLLLPTSPRLNENQVAVAFPVLYDEKASGYDLSSPIAVQVVGGDDIVAGARRVEVGRDVLMLDKDPAALLRQLAGFLSSEAKPKGAGTKRKAKPAASSRSTHVRDLSERLAYAISDADV